MAVMVSGTSDLEARNNARAKREKMTRNGESRARKFLTSLLATGALFAVYCLATVGVSSLMMTATDMSAQARGGGRPRRWSPRRWSSRRWSSRRWSSPAVVTMAVVTTAVVTTAAVTTVTSSMAMPVGFTGSATRGVADGIAGTATAGAARVGTSAAPIGQRHEVASGVLPLAQL